MKKFYFVCFLLFIVAELDAQSVQFISSAKSWNEILLKAKTAQKRVFVDVHTSWCGPCKKMDAEVFVNSAVAAFYNKNFINVKVDAEKGWGVAFAKSNGIDAYPSYLFFNEKGEIVHTSLGFQPQDKFLETGSFALSSNPIKEAADFGRIYALGKYDAGFLYSYLTSKIPSGQRKHNKLELAEEYLSMIPSDSLYSVSSRTLVYRYLPMGAISTEGKIFKILYHDYQHYPIKSGEIMGPWMSLNSRFIDMVEDCAANLDTIKLERLFHAIDLLEQSMITSQREKDFFRCQYYYLAKKYDLFKTQFRKFYHEHILLVNKDSLYHLDSKGFDDACRIRAEYRKADAIFNFNGISNKEFKPIFYPESARTFDELLYLVSLYRKATKIKEFPIEEWLTNALKLYGNNPIFVNPRTVESAKRQLN